jgi:hypothetical protein
VVGYNFCWRRLHVWRWRCTQSTEKFRQTCVSVIKYWHHRTQQTAQRGLQCAASLFSQRARICFALVVRGIFNSIEQFLSHVYYASGRRHAGYYVCRMRERDAAGCCSASEKRVLMKIIPFHEQRVATSREMNKRGALVTWRLWVPI